MSVKFFKNKQGDNATGQAPSEQRQQGDRRQQSRRTRDTYVQSPKGNRKLQLGLKIFVLVLILVCVFWGIRILQTDGISGDMLHLPPPKNPPQFLCNLEEVEVLVIETTARTFIHETTSNKQEALSAFCMAKLELRPPRPKSAPPREWTEVVRIQNKDGSSFELQVSPKGFVRFQGHEYFSLELLEPLTELTSP